MNKIAPLESDNHTIHIQQGTVGTFMSRPNLHFRSQTVSKHENDEKCFITEFHKNVRIRN
jgi:hypothetical protein